MISIHEDHKVRAAQAELEQTLRAQLTSLGKQVLTFRPAEVALELYGRGSGGLYFGSIFVPHEEKLWNSFGLFDQSRRKQDIVVEINFSVAGRRTAGILARDNAGRRYLLHNGGVGGGKKGVSRSTFLAWLKPELVEVLTPDGSTTEAILIGELTADHLAARIERFVRSVKSFKDAVRDGLLADPAFVEEASKWSDYHREFSGLKAVGKVGPYEYVSYHGDIADALKLWVEARTARGYSVTNSPRIDVLVHRGGKLMEVFEVKTRGVRQALYTAIGQLAVHSAGTEARKTLVLPEHDVVPEDILTAIGLAGIRLLRFRIDAEDEVSILG